MTAEKKSRFILPSARHRVSVVGMTGSGKTQFASWLLSEAPFDQQPYVVINYKRDELLEDIPRAKEIGLAEKLPTEPHVYQVFPLPEEDDDAMEDFLRRVRKQTGVGLFIDEGYMIPRNSRAFSTILTQGRSLHIPTIIGSQRPVFLNRFVLSEAHFHAVFRLQNPDDIKKVQGYIPAGALRPLPEYHSAWYDVRQNDLLRLSPVPPADRILERFEERLRPKHTVI